MKVMSIKSVKQETALLPINHFKIAVLIRAPRALWPREDKFSSSASHFEKSPASCAQIRRRFSSFDIFPSRGFIAGTNAKEDNA